MPATARRARLVAGNRNGKRFAQAGSYEDQTSPFCFSNPTSSATSFTITPRERLGGAA